METEKGLLNGMRPPASSWLRSTVTKWAMRFLYKHKPAVRTNNTTPLNLKEIKIRSVRSDWVAVSVEGVGVGIIERSNPTREVRATKYRNNPLGPAVRLLGLCRPPPHMTPADFGLESLVVERDIDGVKVYFGPHDDILAVIANP